MRRVIRQFFPRRNPIRQIPLKTRVYSSQYHRYGDVPSGSRADLRIVAARLSINEDVAAMLHGRHPELTPDQLVRKYKRKRKGNGRVRQAVVRFKRWWNG